MKAVFDHVTWNVPGKIATFAFKPEGRFRFVPGQFTELRIAHTQPDNRGMAREFSIASKPSDTLVLITTTFPDVGQQISTFKQALRALQPGATVDLAQPMGDFVLPKDTSIPVVFVAGGIGVVPVIGMLAALAESDSLRDIQVIHSVNIASALIGDSILSNSSVCSRYIPVVTRTASDGFSGRITASDILQRLDITPQTLFYISGPEQMTKALQDQLHKAGIVLPRIVTDEFSRYSY